MNTFVALNETLEFISDYNGNVNDLCIAISDSLMDPVGMNITIIGDALLRKGIMITGFDQKNGYRILKFEKIK